MQTTASEQIETGADLLFSILEKMEVIKKELQPGEGMEALEQVAELCHIHQHAAENWKT